MSRRFGSTKDGYLILPLKPPVRTTLRTWFDVETGFVSSH